MLGCGVMISWSNSARACDKVQKQSPMPSDMVSKSEGGSLYHLQVLNVWQRNNCIATLGSYTYTLGISLNGKAGTCTWHLHAIYSVRHPISQSRQLVSIFLYAPGKHGSMSYNMIAVHCTQPVLCSPFQPAPNGDCGWWNGGDRTNMSASLIPADMVAALSTSNTDYPGSCGRLSMDAPTTHCSSRR